MAMNGDAVKAMILAAGEGTRLKPLTLETPKVLLPIGGPPLIEYTLTWLRSHGISEVAINLYHLGDKIKDYLGSGSRLGVNISYSQEETLLGTAGGVKRIEHFFNTTFVVVCGDILTDFDLRGMIQFHREKKAMATIAVLEVSNPWDVGIVDMNEEGRILSFIEKPHPGSVRSNLSSGGVYVLDKEILDYIPSQGFCDFAYDIFPMIIKLGLPAYGYCLNHEDYLTDIGTIDKYHQANEDVTAGKVKISYEEQSCFPR